MHRLANRGCTTSYFRQAGCQLYWLFRPIGQRVGGMGKYKHGRFKIILREIKHTEEPAAEPVLCKEDVLVFRPTLSR